MKHPSGYATILHVFAMSLLRQRTTAKKIARIQRNKFRKLEISRLMWGGFFARR
jgi:hypothetical protein